MSIIESYEEGIGRKENEEDDVLELEITEKDEMMIEDKKEIEEEKEEIKIKKRKIRTPKCKNCKGKHVVLECTVQIIRCQNCGMVGHVQEKCKFLKNKNWSINDGVSVLMDVRIILQGNNDSVSVKRIIGIF